MSLLEFKQYINNLDHTNNKLYYIKKELIIYIARQRIQDIVSTKFIKLIDVNIFEIYDNLESLDIGDILKMSKKEDLVRCAVRYKNLTQA